MILLTANKGEIITSSRDTIEKRWWCEKLMESAGYPTAHKAQQRTLCPVGKCEC